MTFIECIKNWNVEKYRIESLELHVLHHTITVHTINAFLKALSLYQDFIRLGTKQPNCSRSFNIVHDDSIEMAGGETYGLSAYRTT